MHPIRIKVGSESELPARLRERAPHDSKHDAMAACGSLLVACKRCQRNHAINAAKFPPRFARDSPNVEIVFARRVSSNAGLHSERLNWIKNRAKRN